MDPEKFSDEIKLILLCAEIDPQKDSLARIKDIAARPLKWGFIWTQSHYHGISPFLYYLFKKEGLLDKIPPDISAKFEYFYNWTILKNMDLWDEFCNIHAMLAREDIKAVPIKGIVLDKILYGNRNIRPMGDIDILVQKGDVLKAETLLSASGYVKSDLDYPEDYYRKYHCHIPYRKKHICEVHWDIAIPRPNRIELPLLWKNTKELNMNGMAIPILSPADNFFTLALHLNRFNSPLSLKYICDISGLIKLYRNESDWDYIVNMSVKNRIKATAYFALFSSKELLGAPVPQDILNNLRPGSLRAKKLEDLVRGKMFSVNPDKPQQQKRLYVFLRLLMYDRLWHFISYVLFMPAEDFARFYSLPLDSKKTFLCYRIRWLYILWRACPVFKI